MHPFRSAGVVGTAHWQGNAGYRGRPDRAGFATPNATSWWRRDRESDRSIRPLRPGNAGGGKGPDFQRALEEGEVRTVIGKRLETPEKIRSLQKKLYVKAKAEPDFRF